MAVAAAAVTLLASAAAYANTSWANGGNWASSSGLTDNVIMYPDGITAGMSTAQAEAVADTVACDYNSVGINFVRYPINPATVTSNWVVTQACINELIADGMTVDICCWYVDPQPQGGNGLIINMTTWQDMWETVDDVYKNNNAVYYEPINEPSGYSLSGLEDVYTNFLGFINKSQGNLILGGTGYEDNVTGIGAWVVANDYSCLLGVHDYAMWEGINSVPGWENDLQGRVGSYYDRTIMTEMGAQTVDDLDYSSSSTDSNICFIQGMCAQCSDWGMGFTYFPVQQAGTNEKRLFYGPGQGVVDPSLILALQSGWGISAKWSTAWDNPAGGSGFTTAFAACSWGPLREDVFGVKSDGNIYHTWYFNGSGWNPWEEHTCTVTPDGAPGASANNGVSGREDIYYIGTDGNLYHQYYNGSWQPSIGTWTEIAAPSGVTLVGSPSATSWGANRYDVYARGSNHTIYHAYSTDGTTWSWQNNGGSVTNDVASESWGPNRLDAYALGTGSGAVWHQYWDGSWHPTQSTWAENTPEADCLYALGASSWGTNRIDLFNNNGENIGHVWYDSAQWNGDWGPLVALPVTPVSAPCSTCWVPNRVDVFVLGSDGKCYHLYWGI